VEFFYISTNELNSRIGTDGSAIVEAILGGRQGPDVTLAHVLEPFQMEWERQPDHFR
jgi:hypothetical protein